MPGAYAHPACGASWPVGGRRTRHRVSLTQAELGALIGAKEVTVHKALRRFEALRLVRRGRRRVTIFNYQGLAEFAKTDADNPLE